MSFRPSPRKIFPDLYRAIDSTGATIDFVLSGLRDAATAKRLFLRALTDPFAIPDSSFVSLDIS